MPGHTNLIIHYLESKVSNITYSDEGCHYYTSCLGCVLSDCYTVIGHKKAVEELIELGLPAPEYQKQRRYKKGPKALNQRRKV